MKFKDALVFMKKGGLVKLPSWRGLLCAGRF